MSGFQGGHLFSCRWLLGGNVPCGFEGSWDAMKQHVTSHFSGPRDARIPCHWEGCRDSRRGKPEVRTMRRESVWRHIRELHLHVKYLSARRVHGS